MFSLNGEHSVGKWEMENIDKDGVTHPAWNEMACLIWHRTLKLEKV